MASRVRTAALRISFTLSERDQRRLRAILRRAGAAARGRDDAQVIAAAEAVAEHARGARPPAYILHRVERLEDLIRMLRDMEWRLPARVRRTALAGLAYFSEPHDLIRDEIPGLGFLDDAIMIELLVRQLEHELRGYEEFCRYRHGEWRRRWARESDEQRAASLVSIQKGIRARIRLRERRDALRAGERGRRPRLL